MSDQQPIFPDELANGRNQMGVNQEKAIPLNTGGPEIIQSSLEQLHQNQNISQMPHMQNELLYQSQQQILQSQMPVQGGNFKGQQFFQQQPIDHSEFQHLNMEMNQNSQINQIMHQFQNFSLNGAHQEIPLQMEQHNQLYLQNANRVDTALYKPNVYMYQNIQNQAQTVMNMQNHFTTPQKENNENANRVSQTIQKNLSSSQYFVNPNAIKNEDEFYEYENENQTFKQNKISLDKIQSQNIHEVGSYGNTRQIQKYFPQTNSFPENYKAMNQPRKYSENTCNDNSNQKKTLLYERGNQDILYCDSINKLTDQMDPNSESASTNNHNQNPYQAQINDVLDEEADECPDEITQSPENQQQFLLTKNHRKKHSSLDKQAIQLNIHQDQNQSNKIQQSPRKSFLSQDALRKNNYFNDEHTNQNNLNLKAQLKDNLIQGIQNYEIQFQNQVNHHNQNSPEANSQLLESKQHDIYKNYQHFQAGDQTHYSQYNYNGLPQFQRFNSKINQNDQQINQPNSTIFSNDPYSKREFEQSLDQINHMKEFIQTKLNQPSQSKFNNTMIHHYSQALLNNQQYTQQPFQNEQMGKFIKNGIIYDQQKKLNQQPYPIMQDQAQNEFRQMPQQPVFNNSMNQFDQLNSSQQIKQEQFPNHYQIQGYLLQNNQLINENQHQNQFQWSKEQIQNQYQGYYPDQFQGNQYPYNNVQGYYSQEQNLCQPNLHQNQDSFQNNQKAIQMQKLYQMQQNNFQQDSHRNMQKNSQIQSFENMQQPNKMQQQMSQEAAFQLAKQWVPSLPENNSYLQVNNNQASGYLMIPQQNQNPLTQRKLSQRTVTQPKVSRAQVSFKSTQNNVNKLIEGSLQEAKLSDIININNSNFNQNQQIATQDSLQTRQMANEEAQCVTTMDNFSQFESLEHSKGGQKINNPSDPSSLTNMNLNSDKINSKKYFNVQNSTEDTPASSLTNQNIQDINIDRGGSADETILGQDSKQTRKINVNSQKNLQVNVKTKSGSHQNYYETKSMFNQGKNFLEGSQYSSKNSVNSGNHPSSALPVVGAVKSGDQPHQSLEYQSFNNLKKNSNNSSQGGYQNKSIKSNQNNSSTVGGSQSHVSNQSSYDEFISQIQNNIKKANKDPDKEFEVLNGNIMKLASKKVGSIFLQEHLQTAKQSLINKIIDQVDGKLADLMTGKYGNFFCSKLIEYLQVHQRIHFLKQIEGKRFIEISCDERGTWALQNILHAATQEEEFEIVRQTLIQDDNILKLSQDKQGHHMINLIITSYPPKIQKEIFNYICGHFKQLAQDQNGLCVMKKIIQYAKNDPEQQKKIISNLMNNSLEYVQHEFGNFVVSEIINLYEYELCQGIFNQILGNFVKLSQHKYSSKLIEVFIDRAPFNLQITIVNEFCDSQLLNKVVIGNFGNYVLQNSLEKYIKVPKLKLQLIESIINCLDQINEYKVQEKWGKDLLVKYLFQIRNSKNKEDADLDQEIEKVYIKLHEKMEKINKDQQINKQKQQSQINYHQKFDQNMDYIQRKNNNWGGANSEYINRMMIQNNKQGGFTNKNMSYFQQNDPNEEENQEHSFSQRQNQQQMELNQSQYTNNDKYQKSYVNYGNQKRNNMNIQRNQGAYTMRGGYEYDKNMYQNKQQQSYKNDSQDQNQFIQYQNKQVNQQQNWQQKKKYDQMGGQQHFQKQAKGGKNRMNQNFIKTFNKSEIKFADAGMHQDRKVVEQQQSYNNNYGQNVFKNNDINNQSQDQMAHSERQIGSHGIDMRNRGMRQDNQSLFADDQAYLNQGSSGGTLPERNHDNEE